jgi:transcriptional regulator with XRE-family HTH domain
MSIVSRQSTKACGRSPKLDWEGFHTPAREYFRENLQRRMDELGWNDSELGRRCKVAPSTVGRWLSGERYPSLETLETIGIAVEMTVSELVAGPDDRQAMTLDHALKVIEAAVKKGKRL